VKAIIAKKTGVDTRAFYLMTRDGKWCKKGKKVKDVVPRGKSKVAIKAYSSGK